MSFRGYTVGRCLLPGFSQFTYVARDSACSPLLSVHSCGPWHPQSEGGVCWLAHFCSGWGLQMWASPDRRVEGGEAVPGMHGLGLVLGMKCVSMGARCPVPFFLHQLRIHRAHPGPGGASRACTPAAMSPSLCIGTPVGAHICHAVDICWACSGDRTCSKHLSSHQTCLPVFVH